MTSLIVLFLKASFIKNSFISLNLNCGWLSCFNLPQGNFRPLEVLQGRRSSPERRGPSTFPYHWVSTERMEKGETCAFSQHLVHDAAVHRVLDGPVVIGFDWQANLLIRRPEEGKVPTRVHFNIWVVDLHHPGFLSYTRSWSRYSRSRFSVWLRLRLGIRSADCPTVLTDSRAFNSQILAWR